ncbi:hypothetical protein Tco_0193854 [Tanacetum coccineum]
MADANHDDVTQVTTYDQVEDDAHVTITAAHVTQKTEIPLVPPADNEIIFMMNVDVRHEEPAEKKRYLDLIKKSVNDEVKTQLPQILPKAATSLTEFELKKILIDKMEKSQLNPIADEHKELYKSLVNSYSVDKDLFLAYSKVVSSKRGRKDKDKDEEPPAGSDQGMKRRKSSKDADSLKGSSKGNTFSQPKSSGKSAQEEEPIHIVDDTEKHKRPSTPNPDWNVGKSVDFRPPQTLISKIAQVEKPSLSSDEFMSTPFNFLTYVMNHLKIDNLTQDHLVGLISVWISQNHKKTVKSGQTRTRESEEFKAESRKVKPQSNIGQ